VSEKKRRRLDCDEDRQPTEQDRCCDCRNIESELIQDYLQVDVDMQTLFKKWKKIDKYYLALISLFALLGKNKEQPNIGARKCSRQKYLAVLVA